MTTPQTKLSAEIYNTDRTKKVVFSPGGSAGSTTIATAQTANAVLTIPDTGGVNANLVLTEGMQTINSNLTFAGNVDTGVVQSNVSVSDPTVIVNSSSSTSGNTIGVMGKRYQTNNDSATGDVIGDTADLTGTLQAGSGTSITLPIGFSSTNNYYVGYWVKMTAGPALNQVRQITAYNGTTKVATTAAWTNAPGANTFNMYGGSYVGLVYDESADSFKLGYVPEITSAAPVVVKNASMTTKNVTTETLTATGITADTITYDNAYERTTNNGMIHNGNVRITGNCTIDGNASVAGSLSAFNAQQLNVRDRFVFQNSMYTTANPVATGILGTTLPATSYLLSGSFAAGVAATSDPNVGTVSANGLTAGDLIQISGSTSNDGIYEVASHSSNVLTIKGQLTSTAEPYTQTQFTAETVSGTINATKVSISGVEFTSTQTGTNYITGSNTGSISRNLVSHSGTSPSYAGLTLTGISSSSVYKALVLDGSNNVCYNSSLSEYATTYSAGQLLIGNNSGGLTAATLTQGSGISITNGNGSITIAATGSTPVPTEYTTPGSYTYNIPSGSKFMDVVLAGAGGGGGAGVSQGGGGGGGGAGSVVRLIKVPIGGATTMSVTVGTGGTGGQSAGSSGGDGSSSTITLNGTTFTAYTGAGGATGGAASNNSGGGGGSAGSSSGGGSTTTTTAGNSGAGTAIVYTPAATGATGGAGVTATDRTGNAGNVGTFANKEITIGGGGGSGGGKRVSGAVGGVSSGGAGGASADSSFAGGSGGTATFNVTTCYGAGGGGGSSGLARGGTGGNGSTAGTPTAGSNGSLGSGGGGGGSYASGPSTVPTGGNGGNGYCSITCY